MQQALSNTPAELLVQPMQEIDQQTLLKPKQQEYNKIETILLESILKNINSPELSNIRTFFFVPVGLPGMGKTTLSKNFRSACQKFFFSQM